MAVTLPSGWANFNSGCIECIDTTARGQQVLTIEEAFDLNTYADRASWGYIADGEVYALGGNAACGGGNMPYASGSTPLPLDCGGSPVRSVAILHYTNDVVALNEALGVPTPPGDGNIFISVIIGASDRSVWAAESNAYAASGGIRMYFDEGTAKATYEKMAGGGTTSSFAISGSETWLCVRRSTTPPFTSFMRFDRTSGMLLDTFDSFSNDNVTVSNMHLTTTNLYCVGTLAGVTRIYKITRSTGAIANSVIVTALSPQFVAVADDDLIYILGSGTPATVYYLENNFTDMIYVGYTAGQGFTPFGGGTAIWNEGNLYYGSNGVGGFNVDIFKIAIDCPDIDVDPIIATVTTDATVAAGAAINVSWANVLVPNVADALQIKPEPPAGTFGLVGSTIASELNAGATQSGTKSITIPGGTTPGNYVAMYCALAGSGNVWVATSAVFTVT